MINKSIKIGQLLENDLAFEVFLSNGFKADSKEDLINSLGEQTMLQTVLKIKNINPELFVELLNQKLDNQEEDRSFNEIYYDEDRELNFLGTAICPLRKTFDEGLEDVLNKYKNETGKTFNCYLHGGHGDESAFEDIWLEKNIDKFPDIILSKGFDDLYRKELIDNLISKGHFKSVNSKDIDHKFIDAGCLDEDYTMHGAFLDVLLVDKNKLGDLPVPKTWNDLLDPIYKDNIVTMKKGDTVSAAIPFYYYKEHGMEGVEKFAANIKCIESSPRIAKIAGTNSEGSAAIYTAPLIFAKSCVKEGLEIVIPDDGALIYPFSMLVKKGKEEELKPLIDFVFDDYGLNLTKSHALCLSSNIENEGLKDFNIKWLGWDFIKSHDMFELSDQVTKVFDQFYKKSDLE